MVTKTEMGWKMSCLLSSVCHIQCFGSELDPISTEVLSDSAAEWIEVPKIRASKSHIAS